MREKKKESKKKKTARVVDSSRGDHRSIPVIRVAPGETEVSINVCNSEHSQSFQLSTTSECTTASQSVSSSQADGSPRASPSATTTPLEVARRRSRTGGRKSYWRRRMEQFDQENEEDTQMMSNTHTNRNPIVQSQQQPRPPKVLQEGCIAALPLTIQVGFRRKMFAVFALQLLLISSLMVLLTYENGLSSLMQSAFKPSAWYILATLAVMVLFLVFLYMGHAFFPLNWMILALFSVALGVFFASVQVYLNTNAGLFCCGFTFVTVTIMIPLSGVKRQAEGRGEDGARALLSTTKTGLIAFGIVMVCAIILYAVYGTRFVTSGSAFGLSLVLEFALILWFSYDASTMYAIMSPDEYMSGVIFFYTDLLVVIVIVIVCGALAVLFSSAGMGAGGFGGSCDCFGCLRIGRMVGDPEDNTTGVIPSSTSVPAIGGRRESYSDAVVLPEEMVR